MDKSTLRNDFRRRRAAVVDPAVASERAVDRLEAIPEFANAGTFLVYVGVRSELATRDRIAAWIAADRDVAVPYCDGDDLRAVRLRSLDELREGRFGIPEPEQSLRERHDRAVAVRAIDLFVVPGLAFDPAGGRLGYGGGYFDRLLAEARPDASIVGLAFDAQLAERLPREPHDVAMNVIVTESTVIRP